jgi:endonuclease III
MKSAKIASLFQKLSDSIPNPKTELCYRNPFELLISVILSAQATDVSVNKVTPELFSAFPTPEEMFEASSEKVFAHIRSIGLAPGETVIKVEQKLMSVVPAKWKKDAHHLLILHGRYVCRARKPDCEHCVISQECEHPDKIVT